MRSQTRKASRSLGQRGPSPQRPVRVFVESHESQTYVVPHCHLDHMQFLIPTQGVLKVASADAFWIVPPKRGIVIPRAFEHSTVTVGRATLVVANIHPDTIEVAGACCRVVNVSELIMALLETIAALSPEYSLDSPESRLVNVFFDQFRAAPAEPFRLSRPRHAKLRAIADTLIAAPDDSTTLAEWGRRLGASQRTLARLFDTETGMCFRDYRKQVQMHAAIGLLATGAPVNQVALDLGYETPSAFIHAFRSAMGMTPGQFRGGPRANR